MNQDAQQQVIERLQQANNVLVTVSANPSVDQLAALIGFTLLLNKMGKHGTAVFSGKVPSTIEFLKPEETIETNTDSLRDFIIALDKSKADKLRYKVEDKVVRIFITPYKTSITEKDLEFSQGDFNVDAVVALGVQERTDLDQAIVSHGRILHDATIISVNNKEQGNLGTINWVNTSSSSLSEMLVELSRALSPEALDPQMATAFMTGIVAETERFSNTKTKPRTMTLASDLMTAGANQQLIAAKLEEGKVAPKVAPTSPAKAASPQPDTSDADGSLHIKHEEAAPEDATPPADLPPVVEPAKPPLVVQDSPREVPNRQPMILQPPSIGGDLTANSHPEGLEPSIDPLAANSNIGPAFQPILRHPAPAKPPITATTTLANLEQDLAAEPAAPAPAPAPAPTAVAPEVVPPVTNEAPAAIAEDNLEEARDAVNQAITAEPNTQTLPPVQALNAQPIDLGTVPAQTAPVAPVVEARPTPGMDAPSVNGVNPNIPSQLMPHDQPTDATIGNTTNPSAPPPVPPPMLVPNDNQPGTL
ncbi:MAG: hypothetical protein ABI221_01075 [Candidatus Saccharimonadales bacterium]